MTMKKTLQQWLDWQEKLHWQSIDLGLERCRIVAERLDLLKPPFKIITVAGTNGKGSSVVMLENIYKSNRYKVARYTSPYLVSYNERVVINGEMPTDEDFCEAFEAIEKQRKEVSLTYFEYGTLAAVWILHKNQIDIAILEVGMGGRLDAVNVWNADAALITAIDIDHTAFLGNDRETIAREKAGILRFQKPAVCSDPNPPQSLLNYAKQLDIDLKVFKRDFELDKEYEEILKHLPAYQLQNAAGVVQLVELFDMKVTKENIKKGLQTFQWNGRFQHINAPCECILDVAHNPQGARVLRETLQQKPCEGETFALVGMLNNKDIFNSLKEMLPVVDHWNVVSLTGERGEKAIVLEKHLCNLGITNIQTYSTVWEGYQNLLSKVKPLDRLIIFGSFYTVAAILERISL
jgi:dihydrofolate synthase/folylpolyglutamate synthase